MMNPTLTFPTTISKAVSAACTLVLLLLQTFPTHSQKVLIVGEHLPIVNQALEILRSFEPDIYQRVVRECNIQQGEAAEGPPASYSIIEMPPIKTWILLHPNLLEYGSAKKVASTILHEAMHLQNSLLMINDPDWNTNKKKSQIEHTAIYNYQLLFLREVGAPAADIERVKSVMRELSIPIL